jgi:hypothetical protein
LPRQHQNKQQHFHRSLQLRAVPPFHQQKPALEFSKDRLRHPREEERQHQALLLMYAMKNRDL